MTPLIGLLLTLWGLVGSHTTVYQLDRPVQFTDLYGSQREASAALGCTPGGRAELWVGPGADLETIVHELAHAYDCIDNGVMDASPTLRPLARPQWVSDYCWLSDAEWYACSVIRYGTIEPHEVAPWGPAALAAAGNAPSSGSTLGPPPR